VNCAVLTRKAGAFVYAVAHADGLLEVVGGAVQATLCPFRGQEQELLQYLDLRSKTASVIRAVSDPRSGTFQFREIRSYAKPH